MQKPILIFVIATVMVLGAIPELPAQSPGDTVGTTGFLYQTVAASGDRIAVDGLNGVHFVWTKGVSYGRPRYVYYNYLDPDGNWLNSGGADIGGQNGSGHCQLDLTIDDCAAVAFHSIGDAGEDNLTYGQDLYSGFGIFELFDVPNMLSQTCLWPNIDVDANEIVHIVMREWENYTAIGYTRSVDGGENWSNLVPVDTIIIGSHLVTSSPVSGKVAIVYSHPSDSSEYGGNDIYFIESLNGTDWDWENGKINLTEYGHYGDSLFAYADLDAIYDYEDNLHIIWNAVWITEQGLGEFEFLYHYERPSVMISLVDSAVIDLGDCATYLPISKMTLGVQEETGALFTVYSRFGPGDCSSSGYPNGEIYMQYSIDDGISWSAPENVTDSQSPDCYPGDCLSDIWPSLADRVTDHLHIFYLVDRAGGGDWEGESPLLYYAYPVPVLSVDEDKTMPRQFQLHQNHPNPFNATTTIEFELFEDSHARLVVYDITGALVEILHDGDLGAGSHSIVWDAGGSASGVYYYHLLSSEGSLTRRMVLLK
jgi:hypothetical protein